MEFEQWIQKAYELGKNDGTSNHLEQLLRRFRKFRRESLFTLYKTTTKEKEVSADGRRLYKP
jgi:hypothetical protein